MAPAPHLVEYRKLLTPTEFKYKKKRVLLGNKEVTKKITGNRKRSKLNFVGKAVDAVAKTVSTQANTVSKVSKIKKSLAKQAVETEKITNLTEIADQHKQDYETANKNFTEFKNRAESSINDLTNSWANLTIYEKQNKISDLKNRGIISKEFKIDATTTIDLIEKEIKNSIDNASREYNKVKKTTEETQKNLESSLERLKEASNKIKKYEEKTKVGKSSQAYMTAARKARERSKFLKPLIYSTYSPKQLDILAKVSASEEDISIEDLKNRNPGVKFDRGFINKINKIKGSRELSKFVEAAKRSTQNTNRLVTQGSNAVLDLKNMENSNLAQFEGKDLPVNIGKGSTKSSRKFETERQFVLEKQKEKLKTNLSSFTTEYFTSSENPAIKDVIENITIELGQVTTFDELLNKFKKNNLDAYEKISKDPTARAEYDKFIRDKALELPDTQRTFLLAEIERQQSRTAVVKLGLTVDTTVEKIANAKGFELNKARTALKEKSTQYLNLSTKNIADAIKIKHRRGTLLTIEETNFINEYNTTLEAQISKSKKAENTISNINIPYPKETPNAADLNALTKNKGDPNVTELTNLFTRFKDQPEFNSATYLAKLKTNKALYGDTLGELLTQLQISNFKPNTSMETVNAKLEKLLNNEIIFSTSISTSAELKANLLQKFKDAANGKQSQPLAAPPEESAPLPEESAPLAAPLPAPRPTPAPRPAPAPLPALSPP
jgi:hypothetical protein